MTRLNREVAVLRTSDAVRAREALLGDPLLTDADIRIDPDGTVLVQGGGDRTGALCRRVVESGVEVHMLGTQAFTLEDHFIQMTGGSNHAESAAY